MLITNEKINKMKKSLLFIFLMAMGTAIFAQQYCFTNGGDDLLWNNPQNWDQGSVPNSSDHEVFINDALNPYNVEVQADAFCGYLLLGNSSNLVVRNNATLTVSYPPNPTGINIQIVTSSTLTIDAGGKLEFDGKFLQQGILIVNGTVDLVPPPPSK